MQNGAFPFDLAKAKEEGRLLDNGTQPLLDMSKVKFWIELGQLAPTGAGLFVHTKGEQGVVDEVLLGLLHVGSVLPFVFQVKRQLKANGQGLAVKDTTRVNIE